MRVCNAAGFEIMTLGLNSVGMRFNSLIGEKLVGVRHAGDGDCTREEPVGVVPFVDVRVGLDCEGEADFLR